MYVFFLSELQCKIGHDVLFIQQKLYARGKSGNTMNFVNLFLSLEEKTYVLNDMHTGKMELKNNQQHKYLILIYESTLALPSSNLELASVSQ